MLSRFFQHLLLLLVRGYRYWFKPWLGNSCRFEPSCSAYAQQALQQHGAARGAALAGWRLLRCQPWCEGGCDEVPERWTSAWAGAEASRENHSKNTRWGPFLFTALLSSKATSTPVDVAPDNRKQT